MASVTILLPAGKVTVSGEVAGEALWLTPAALAGRPYYTPLDLGG